MNYVYIAGPLFDDHERNYLESIAEIFETRGYKTFLPHRDAGVVSGEYTKEEKKTNFHNRFKSIKASRYRSRITNWKRCRLWDCS